MIVSLFRKYIKRSFFNKILIAYSLITICSIFILTEVSLFSFSKTMEARELDLSSKILNRVASYIDEKHRSALTIYRHMYANAYFSDTAGIWFFDNSNADNNQRQLETKTSFDRMLSDSFQSDPDIVDIAIKRYSDGDSYLTESYSPQLRDPKPAINSELFQESNELAIGFSMLPAHIPSYIMNKQYVYTMGASVMDLKLTKKLGEIYIEFKAAKVKDDYSEYANGLKGDILILSLNGDVMFDSSGNYYGAKYPYFDKLIKNTTKANLGGDSIVNIVSPHSANVLVVGVIPKSEIYIVSKTIKQTVYLISAICLIASLVMAYLSTKSTSRRAKKVTDAMQKLRSGDLSTRIAIHDSEDELGQIAANFNEMCDSLQNYINKVYLSEIKQKNAQLSALQSQINPHFLYNTLETIRMRAITKGDEDAGEMIHLLAVLFRSTIREEMVIQVRDEIKYCNMYLELFKIRFGDKLTSTIDVEEGILDCGIPKHLLQPAVENYIVHGFEPDRGDNHISISGQMRDGDVVFTIADNGKGISPEKLEELRENLRAANSDNSIGLPNVNERIKLIYGEQYGLNVTHRCDGGILVTIHIQAVTREELKSHVQNTDRG